MTGTIGPRGRGVIAAVAAGLLISATAGVTAVGGAEPPDTDDTAYPAPDTNGDPAISLQQAAGTSATAIQSAVDAFREDLGDLNPNVAGSLGSGRREINWDGTPDQFAAPNQLPNDFFNVNTPRGAVFATTEGGVQVSGNEGVAPIEFDNLNPQNSSHFTTFSPQRLFAPDDENVVDVLFFVPGSDEPATVSGFGAVFTDVDRDSSSIEYFSADGRLLGRFDVPASPGSETLSFLGVRFHDEQVSMVRIRSGSDDLDLDEVEGRDIVAMDDFIYGEPVAYS